MFPSRARQSVAIMTENPAMNIADSDLQEESKSIMVLDQAQQRQLFEG
jgi:hypothetical protein